MEKPQFGVGSADRHKHGIGASEAATVLGLNPYQTVCGLFDIKTGKEEPPDLSQNNAVVWGNWLEDTIREYIKQEMNTPVRRSNLTHWHNDKDFMYCHVDGIKVGVKELVEIKTAGQFSSSKFGDGEDDVPEQYIAQCQHMLACFPEFSGVSLYALIGGRDLREYYIARDNEFIEMLETAEGSFWDLVKSNTPPEPMTAGDVEKRFPVPLADAVIASNDVLGNIKLLKDIQGRLKELKAEEDRVKGDIKRYMREFARMVDFDGREIATWKAQTSSRFDQKGFKDAHPDLAEKFVKESSFRSLRIK